MNPWDSDWTETATMSFIALMCFGVIGLVGFVIHQAVTDVDVTEGEVTQKEFIPERYWTHQHEIGCAMRNAEGLCLAHLYSPHEHYDPPQWLLYISDDADRDGDVDTDWVHVPEQEYYDVKIGQWYRIGHGVIPR